MNRRQMPRDIFNRPIRSLIFRASPMKGETRLFRYSSAAGAPVCVVCGRPFHGQAWGAPRVAHARKHVREGKAREAINREPWGGSGRYVFFTKHWIRGRRV